MSETIGIKNTREEDVPEADLVDYAKSIVSSSDADTFARATYDPEVLKIIGRKKALFNRFKDVVLPLLEKPTRSNADWKESASCRELSDRMFIIPRGDGYEKDGYDGAEIRKIARAVCSVCNVRVECRETANMLVKGAAGIWGGHEYPYNDKTERKRRENNEEAA